MTETLRSDKTSSISTDHQSGGPRRTHVCNRLTAEVTTSASGSHIDSRTADRQCRSVNAVGRHVLGDTHLLTAIVILVTTGVISLPVPPLFHGGATLAGSSFAMFTPISDAEICTTVSIESSFSLPTATIADDNELDEAIVSEGFLVLDGEKLAAYPQQDDVVAIRHSYMRVRATGLWGEFEPLLLDHFDRFNVEHFDGKLPRLEVKMGPCASPRTILGEYALRGDHGMLGEITINQRLFHNGVKGVIIEDATRPGFIRYIDDILLHEMVHAYCHLALRQPEDSYRGHGPVFTSECNRIGVKLGLNPVRSSKSKKKVEEHMQRCNQWPHCVRDTATYYLGAVVNVEEASTEVEDDELANLLAGDEIGPGEMLRRLIHLARNTRNNRHGRDALANALVAGLRLVTEKPDLLPQFPANLVAPGLVPDPTAT